MCEFNLLLKLCKTIT